MYIASCILVHLLNLSSSLAAAAAAAAAAAVVVPVPVAASVVTAGRSVELCLPLAARWVGVNATNIPWGCACLSTTPDASAF